MMHIVIVLLVVVTALAVEHIDDYLASPNSLLNLRVGC